MTNSFPHLPQAFELGAGTASYHFEGAVTEEGRGPSIWDTFCAEPGRSWTEAAARCPVTTTTGTSRTSRPVSACTTG